jgi:hypothetical protein
MRLITCLLSAIVAAAAAERFSYNPRVKARSEAERKSGQGTSTAGLPDSRPFYLGFTPEDLRETPEVSPVVSDALARHADLVAVHIDRGIPWEEALQDQPFPAAVERHLSRLSKLKQRLPAARAVYLALTPIALTRNVMAKYWGDNKQLAKKWQEKAFNDPETALAFTRYCRRMIGIFKPDYFAYGIEVNMLAGANPKKFEEFRVLAKQVYGTLKREHPRLPIFLTIQIDVYHKIPTAQAAVLRQVLPYSDFIAVSSYPYMEGHSADSLPAGWFTDVAALDRQKPFVIAETAFIAEGSFTNITGKSVKGSAQEQSAYVRRILHDTNRLNGRFVVWFFAQDLDQFWEGLSDPAVKKFVGIWKDSGLVDGAGREREGLKEWDRWLRQPRRPVR